MRAGKFGNCEDCAGRIMAENVERLKADKEPLTIPKVPARFRTISGRYQCSTCYEAWCNEDPDEAATLGDTDDEAFFDG